MNKDVAKEMFAMNEAIKELLKYTETVAQLAALGSLQEHFVKLCGLLKE